MDTNFIIFFIILAVTVIINAWTDAPNSIAGLVSARILGVHASTIFAALFNFLGALFSGTAVAVTASSLVLLPEGKESLIPLSIALCVVVLWSCLSLYLGFPVSGTYALLSALSGSVIALGGGTFTPEPLIRLISGIIISAGIGVVFSFILSKIIRLIFDKIKTDKKSLNSAASGGELFFASSMAFLHGSQCGQKFMAVLYMGTLATGINEAGQFAKAKLPLIYVILLALLISAGTSFGGLKILRNVGVKMVSLKKYQALSSDMAASITMFFATFFGIPLSTTAMRGSTIVGSAMVERKKGIKWQIASSIFGAWLITIPVCFLAGFLMAKATSWL